MKYENIEYLINKYIDADITDSERKELDMHLKESEECKELFDEMVLINEMLGDIKLKELPENYESELNEKLENGNIIQLKNQTMKTTSKVSKKSKNVISKGKIFHIKSFVNGHKKGFIALAASFIIGFASYNALMSSNLNNMNLMMDESVSSPMSMDMASAPEMDMLVESAPSFKSSIDGETLSNNTRSGNIENSKAISAKTTKSSSINTNNFNGRKIIKNGNFSIEVEDFDKTITSIYQIVKNYNGYIENFSSYDNGKYISSIDKKLKSGNITIRIPENKFYDFFNLAGDFGEVNNKNIYTSDITSQYRDYENEVANLEVREKKLREIMNEAKNIKDVIEVERELSLVRGEINRYKGNLKNWDEEVSLSSINISIVEVEKLNKEVNPIDKSIWQKSKEGLITNINKMVTFVQILIVLAISNLPIIIILTIIASLIYIYYKKKKNLND
ncbi:DUF4349 domain-containing protein [Helicovermis profundi]|uniref:DUF4349 domain-containing protein n=1 Tax=Helicovermis profundi TaxID=3065157 RepID=A0AAU9E3H4_9FIRM|nr:hypothetical protein HLPR_15070 [Clostridia bacterium S502]